MTLLGSELPAEGREQAHQAAASISVSGQKHKAEEALLDEPDGSRARAGLHQGEVRLPSHWRRRLDLLPTRGLWLPIRRL